MRVSGQYHVQIGGGFVGPRASLNAVGIDSTPPLMDSNQNFPVVQPSNFIILQFVFLIILL
jgi:hypothetical protein